MSEFDRETEGRVARAEISVFDAMMAEILRDRNAEKEAHRKHRENRERRTPGNNSMRHLENMCARNWKTWMSGKTNADFRAESLERSLRMDWTTNTENRAAEEEAYAYAMAEARDYRKYAENAMAGYIEDCASGWELEYALEYMDMAQAADRKVESLRIGLEVR